jgi:hypothetical protein
MLAFKKNIYASTSSIEDPAPRSALRLEIDPLELLKAALEEEKETIDFLVRQPPEFWREDGRKFYPHLYPVGTAQTMKILLEKLWEGLISKSGWHHMNTYHYCFLYDVLIRFAFNYNHDNNEERNNTLPQLEGKPLRIKLFIHEYFINTVFLLVPDQYNAMTGEEKIAKGYNCPTQFAVINGLSPTREETDLILSEDYPYSIYV